MYMASSIAHRSHRGTRRPSSSHYNEAREIFSDVEEQQLVRFITETYTDKCRYETDDDFEFDTRNFFDKITQMKMEEALVRLSQINPGETFAIPEFKCSPDSQKLFENATLWRCAALISSEYLPSRPIR
jgi:hypothetical protein